MNSSNHSLNLCCLEASKVDVQAISMSGIVERIYTFFSNSTIRWDVLVETAGIRVKRARPTRWSTYYESVKHVVMDLDGMIAALEWLSADPYNKDTQADAQSLLASLGNFYVIALLEFWVQVLAPVDRCQKILQDPACNVMTAGDVLKKLGQNFIQKRDKVVEQAINRATSWCEGREIPVERQWQKRKIIPGESAEDTVLSATQNAC